MSGSEKTAIPQAKKTKILTAIILAGCAIVAVFLFYLSAKETVNGPFARLGAFLSPSPLAETYYDGDADGLADTEEKDFGTDAAKPDTDGDGYLDGEEIAQDTDPLKADSIPNTESVRSLLADQESNNNMSRELVGSVLSDIAANDRIFYTSSTTSEEVKLHVSYSQSDMEALAQNITNQLLQKPELSALRNIDDDEINIINDDSIDTVNEYVLSLMDIITNKEQVERLHAFFVNISSGVSEGGIVLTTESKKEGEIYVLPTLSTIEKELRMLKVPGAWKELHKDQIALIAGQRLAASYMLSQSGDPMQQFYGLALLEQVQNDSTAWKEQAVKFLESYNS